MNVDAGPNPYASPESEIGPLPQAERRFGLSEPIQAAGTLTLGDVRRAAIAGQKLVPWWQKVVYLVGFLLFPVIWLMSEPAFGLASVSIVLGWGLFGILLLLTMRPGRWLSRAKDDDPIEEQQLLLSEEGVVLQSANARALRPWLQFSHFRGDAGTVVLHLVDPVGFVVLPRRFFATENEWQAAVELVRFKLPEHGTPAARESPPRGPLPPSAEPQEALGPDDEAVAFSGRPTARELAALRRFFPYTRTATIAFAAMLVLLPAFIGRFMIASHGPDSRPPVAMATLVLSVLFFYLFILKPLYRRRRDRLEGRGNYALVSGHCSGRGIVTTCDGVRGETRWEAFSSYRRSETVVLLVSEHGGHLRSYHVFYQSLFPGDGWQRFNAMVERKLPPQPKRRWWQRRKKPLPVETEEKGDNLA